MSTCAVHFMSLILINFLKRNNKGTQPWSNGNWPFSMENMSRRWFGDGVPAYLPPLFLLTKQAMSATRVRSTTAHMVPMIQPWVEMSLRWPSAPEKQNQDGELKDQCVFEYDSPLKPSSYNFIFDWKQNNMMDSSLRGCSHIIFDTPYNTISSERIFDRRKTKTNAQRRRENKYNHIHHSQYQFINDMPVLLWQVTSQITKLHRLWHLSLLSPLTWVWITSSKMLALSSSLLAMRRTVYTAPGWSPSITWKLWEVLTASEIRQLPSPTQPSTRSAQAASLY